MRYCNFSYVVLQGAVVDGATHVPESPIIQVMIEPELGNGLGGNGGANGELGYVDVESILVDGKVDSSLFSLERVVDGKNVDLVLTVEEGTTAQQGYRSGVVTNLFFRPVDEKGELLKLVSLKPYLFLYTSYLPVVWR